VPLNAFEKGKLKIAAHVREELERAAIPFDDIRCQSGGLHTPRDTTRVSVTLAGESKHVDLKAGEVEECESIVVGEVWYKIASFIEQLK
jgi:hypothetical protein